MAYTENEWISKRAYAIWEEEGHPHGRDSDHWLQASSEFERLNATAATKPARTRKAPAKTAAAAIDINPADAKVSAPVKRVRKVS